jgi:cation diffusion facilitator CzcD-associated flavoprotein CzcO
MAPESPIRRVAVIGAGPAGAIAADALAKERVFDTIRVFDRKAGIGGTWVATPHLPASIPSLAALQTELRVSDPPVPIPNVLPAVTEITRDVNDHAIRYSDSAIHEHLHSNITPEIMSFTQEPIPGTLSEYTVKNYGANSPYRHHTIIREYLEGIFNRVPFPGTGGLQKALSLSTAVERAVKEAGEWVLTLRQEREGRNYWWRERFDALVVASGHYNVPWLPDIPGLVEFDVKFPGVVVHSKHFRKAEEYRGKVSSLGPFLCSTKRY